MTDAAYGWAEVFDEAADSYDEQQLSFFDDHADALVALVDIRPGHRVLDVATGTGKVARRAAATVGASGLVVGIDVSPSMLRAARAKASPRVRLSLMDARGLALRDRSFDVATCAFGLTFMGPRVVEVVREMRRVVRPGGLVAVATFAEGAFSPMLDPFLSALEDVGIPRPRRARPRWMGLDRERHVTRLLRSGGLAERRVVRATAGTTLREPDDLWVLLGGTAWRSVLRRLSPEATTRVRDRLDRRFDDMRGEDGVRLDTSALIGIGVTVFRRDRARLADRSLAADRVE